LKLALGIAACGPSRILLLLSLDILKSSTTYCLLLSTTFCYYVLLSATVCYYLLLSTTLRYCLLLSAAVYYYRLLSAIVCYSLLLFAGTVCSPLFLFYFIKQEYLLLYFGMVLQSFSLSPFFLFCLDVCCPLV
jgi:hypothetical protein